MRRQPARVAFTCTFHRAWPVAKAGVEFRKSISRELAKRNPKLITAEYRVAKRPPGRVLVDYNQNAWNRTLASVYSVRPKPAATVSTPVTWEEVERGVRMEDFTMQTVPARLAQAWATCGSRCSAQRGRVSPGAILVTLPVSHNYPPMEAQIRLRTTGRSVTGITSPNGTAFGVWLFATSARIDLQSKSGKPLTRYFPELVAALIAMEATKFVLDGEIVIPVDGDLSFDDLLMRIHPAASRVLKLSKETPCGIHRVRSAGGSKSGKYLVNEPLRKRRAALEKFREEAA